MAGIHKIIEVLNNITSKGLEYFGIYYSEYNGIVTDVDDPKGYGRIKIKCPEVYNQTIFPEWVIPRAMYSGKNYGFRFTPEVGDIVSISFRYGDPRYPRWDFGYFGEVGEEPDIDMEELKETKKKWFRTPEGLMLCFNDKDKHIEIQYPEGPLVRVSKDSIDLVVENELINLGSLNEAEEWAVKGDTWQSQQEKILDAIANITVQTVIPPLGGVTGGTFPSTPPLNLGSFISAKAELPLAKSKKVKLD